MSGEKLTMVTVCILTLLHVYEVNEYDLQNVDSFNGSFNTDSCRVACLFGSI